MNTPTLPLAGRTVLFVFSIYNFYREMMPVAEYFAGQGVQVHAVLGWSGETAVQATEQCKAFNFIVHHLPTNLTYSGELPTGQQSDPGRGAPKTKWEGFIVRALLPLARALRSVVMPVGRQLHIRKLAGELIGVVAPSLVFAGAFHSCGEFDNAIARICHKKGIPFCCLPVSIYAGGERLVVTARFNNVKLGMLPRSLKIDYSFFNTLAAVLFPNWTRERDGTRIFMFPPAKMLVAWLSGLLEKNPWQKPSELFDMVFVEADFSTRMLAESDYDVSKVVVSGKPLLDVVFENLTNNDYVAELYGYLGLSVGEPFVLFNVEPSAEHSYSSWEDHWRRFGMLMDCMKETSSKVILSLHPLCDPANYRYVEQKYGFKVSEKYKIGQLYPYCNLSVSFPCSTNAFSLIFNRKLIIYDFFGLTKDEYPTHDLYRVQGASYANDIEQLSRHIHEYMNGPVYKAPPSNSAKGHSLACATIYRTVVERFNLV